MDQIHSADHGPVAELADAADLKSALPVHKLESQNALQASSGTAQRIAQRASAADPDFDADLDRHVNAWPSLNVRWKRAIVAILDACEND